MFHLAVGNVHNKVSAVQQLLAHGDYVMLNESDHDVRVFLSKLTGFGVFVPPGSTGKRMCHVWRTPQLRVMGRNSRTVMRGGYRGLEDARVSRAMKRRYRKRRLGPDRMATATLTADTEADGALVLLVNVWLIAKSSTSERWRWPVMALSQAHLRLYLHQLRKRHPGVPAVLAGDTNLTRLGMLKLGSWWRQVNTPPDMGGHHFTQVHCTGDVDVRFVRELRNASDHDAFVLSVKVGADAPREVRA